MPELGGLSTRIVGPSDAKLTVILLHGFGASGEDLVPLAQALRLPSARFVFPAAPIELGGMYGDARAWWMIDLMKLEQDLRTGAVRDRSAEVPDGLADARAHIDALIAELELPADHQLVIGGFSQGAMLSLDVALHREQPPAGLVLMSGTLIAAREWAPLMPKLAGVPIAMSHGTRDPLLPFAIAETLRDQLRAAGAAVEWTAFPGAHEIPMPALAAVASFLKTRAGAAVP